jgi:hypothetical protein
MLLSLHSLGFCLVSWVAVCFAIPFATPEIYQKRQDAPSSDLPCLDLMAAAAQGMFSLSICAETRSRMIGMYVFAASDVYHCLRRVPFNSAVALRFLDYYNDTLQYQSTLAFLEDPPAEYQRPPVKVHEELKKISVNITSGAYKSQYEFETQVQVLISRLHDSHVNLDAGILSAFKFASPYTLVSVSEDGVQEPRVYLQEDVLAAANEGYKAFPISKINGLEVVDYLSSLVAPNSDGYVEPHADWNSLMESPARDVQGYLSLFQRLTLYPGDDLIFTLENGTQVESIWLALYTNNYPTGPLTTGGDFFNYFVLGLSPAGFNITNPTKWWSDDYDLVYSNDTTQSSPEPAFDCKSSAVSWCTATDGVVRAYPNDPIVVQNDFSIAGAGSVSGYIIDGSSTSVLSMPGFYHSDKSVRYFYNAVDEFIGNATKAGSKRVIIDLQQNSGGLVFLAILTFQQFFPRHKPYTGSRIRSHESADILGTAYSKWWASLDPESAKYEDFTASEWVSLNRINDATNRTFSSWQEYFGPVLDRNDAFSQKVGKR